MAQLLSVQKESPYKIKAYRRAARTIENLAESLEELVRSDADLTAIPGIGQGIGGTIREIVQKGGLPEKVEVLRANLGERVASLTDYPALDPKQVERVYKKLKISTVEQLRRALEQGEIGEQLGQRMEQHIRQGLMPKSEILLYQAHQIAPQIIDFLRTRCNAQDVVAVGEYRRCVEVIAQFAFVVRTASFDNLVHEFQRYGGGTRLIEADATHAKFQLPSGLPVRVTAAEPQLWGLALLTETGSEEHVRKLTKLAGSSAAKMADSAGYPDEKTVYKRLGLPWIPPELREGVDEIEIAAAGKLPRLVEIANIRGELHAHTTASDGVHTLEQMAEAAQKKGYEYLGITDHSQSLTIAHGVPEAEMWQRVREIDTWNARNRGFRILKSAEVDILADGSLDYSDALLKELDYTVCSIHSKFSLGKTAQTERLLRAMDNRYFNILGHATGRRLLKRAGYDFDLDRVLRHAKQNNCFFEINSSPERLDVSAANARLVWKAGVRIAINTDAHSTREFDYVAGGVEQARRAGLSKEAILNCLPWSRLQRLLRR